MRLVDNEILINEIVSEMDKIDALKDGFVRDVFTKDFSYRFCWSSNAIEGNTLTLDETISLIEYDEVKSGHTFSEYQEAKNLFYAIEKMMLPLEEKTITEDWIKKCNQLIMGSSDNGYRNGPVYIGSIAEAVYFPPAFERVPELMNGFMTNINRKGKTITDVIGEIALQHILFERIHPFGDGNGRTGRMILNQQLLNNGLLPVVIQKKSDYRQAFRRYDKNGDSSMMEHIICKAEVDAIQRLDQMLMQMKTQEKSVKFVPYHKQKKSKEKGFEI